METTDYQVSEIDVLNGLYLRVPDTEAKFHRLEYPPKMINDYPVATKEDRNNLHRLLVTTYTGDTLDAVPSCICGKITERDVRCGDCGTVAAPVTERPIEPAHWMRVPEHATAFILPAVWTILTQHFGTRENCAITWIVNPRYRPKNAKSNFVNRLLALNVERGLNNFIEKFDEIIELLIERKFFKHNKNPGRLRNFRQYIAENREKLFPTVLPLPPSLNFIKESTSTGTYTDETVTYALDAVNTVCALNTPGVTIKPKQAQYSTYKVIDLLATYYNKLWRKSLSSKAGLSRKHICGGRPDWSFRSVITSIHGVHDHRELHVPWALAVTVFREHLRSLLLKEGNTYIEATNLLTEHTLRFNQKIYDLLNSIIHAPKPEIAANDVCTKPIQDILGASTLFQRNPTLLRLSAQNLFISRIKTDMNDFTISLSNIVLKGLNADFDGDALNGLLMLDEESKRAAKRLAPHIGLVNAGKVRGSSGTSILPKPALSVLNSFLTHDV